MSALNKIKGLLLNELKGTQPEVRKAILRVFNSIDSDLDIGGYEASSEVDESLENLFTVLSEVNYDNDEPPVLPSNPVSKKEPALKEIDRSDRDEEES